VIKLESLEREQTMMTEEQTMRACKLVNEFLANSGYVLIRLEDLERIREVAAQEGILGKLQALNIQVHSELEPSQVDEE
jgi:hypothetical protein